MEILTLERVRVDVRGDSVVDKVTALRTLAELLASAVGVPSAVVEECLQQRERLQSTGIGDGVAVPHAALDGITQRAAALLLCPCGLAFDAIDQTPVRIVFGVVGPRAATGEHLRVLARISRILRDGATRAELIEALDAERAFGLLRSRDEAAG